MEASPCGRCHETSENGLICDGCDEAWCIPCVNQCSADLVLNEHIYERLTALGEFGWKCAECTEESLLEQFERTFTVEELIDLGGLGEEAGPSESREAIDAQVNDVDSSSRVVSKAETCMTWTPGVKVTKSDKQRPSPIMISPTDESHETPDSTSREPKRETTTGVPDRGQRTTLEPTGATSTSGDAISQMIGLVQQQLAQQNLQQIQMNELMARQQKETQDRFVQMMTWQQNQMKDVIEAFRTKNATPAHATGPTQASAIASDFVKLPKIDMPTFDGKITEWSNFWESFEINVNARTGLNDKQKLDLLYRLLKGPALDKIKGLGLQGENYENRKGDPRATL